MQRIINIERFYIAPCAKIVDNILSIGDEQNGTTAVKADVTDWNIEEYTLESQLNVLYPKHTIEEIWGCTYRQGDFAETHCHRGFDKSFVWFVDTCTHCSPLIFPDPEHPWMPPLASIRPSRGNLIVFNSNDIHYVPPHTCKHHRMVLSGNMSLNKEVQ
jgi:hypothetical protein|tara:strand:- start:227 stop:703 length:477 start_codon:yes stop_codon:yes gene_type:complete